MSIDQQLLTALERALRSSADTGKHLDEQQQQLREIWRITAAERAQNSQEIALMRQENHALAQQCAALRRQLIDLTGRVETLTELLARLSGRSEG